jgi:indoleacetamide hydrolase
VNNDDDLTGLSAVAAIAAMKSGDVSAEQYARTLLDRAQRLERLNAFRTLQPQSVLEAARAADRARAAGAALGALHGLPIPVKDSVNTRSLPTSNGTLALRDFCPKNDATVLEPLFAQGAILMGKTNIHELSRGWTSNNTTFGAVRNPYGPEHIPGGSSGGSGAAVAARIAPLAVAEDTLGSIRVPASMCGVVGLRPTFGRYPGAGIMSLSLNKFDQVGPLARSVADLALFDSVVTDDSTPLASSALEDVRIGISSEYLLSGLDPEVERVTSAVLRRLQDAGVTLVDAPLPQTITQALAVVTTIIGYENIDSISGFLREYATGVTFEELIARSGPIIQGMYKDVLPPSREAYEEALQQRAQLRQAIREHFTMHSLNAISFPPVLAPPPPLGDNLSFQIRGEQVSIRKVMGRNTALGSAASLCSLVLPGGLAGSGLPIGIEFAALPGEDRALLALGAAIERVLDPLPAPRL